MIRETFEQYEIIEEASGHAFQEELNRAMRIHKEQNPKSKIEIAGPTWRAVVIYEERVTIPETKEDAFYIQTGKHLTCSDCPYFHLPAENKTFKYMWCDLDGHIKKKKADSFACEWLYEKIEKEEVNI